MIANLPIGILFCPTVLDFTSLAGKSNVSAEVSEKLTEIEATCTNPDFKDRVRDLAVKTAEMSNQQILRLLAWARLRTGLANPETLRTSVTSTDVAQDQLNGKPTRQRVRQPTVEVRTRVSPTAAPSRFVASSGLEQ